MCPSTLYSRSEKSNWCLLFARCILGSQIFCSHPNAFSRMSFHDPRELYSHFYHLCGQQVCAAHPFSEEKGKSTWGLLSLLAENLMSVHICLALFFQKGELYRSSIEYDCASPKCSLFPNRLKGHWKHEQLF